MEMNTEDYLKKSLLETQERVRDFKNYSERIEDDEIRNFFKEYAISEGKQAFKLQKFLESVQN